MTTSTPLTWPEPTAGGAYIRNADGSLTCVQPAAAPAPMRNTTQASASGATSNPITPTDSPEE